MNKRRTPISVDSQGQSVFIVCISVFLPKSPLGSVVMYSQNIYPLTISVNNRLTNNIFTIILCTN